MSEELNTDDLDEAQKRRLRALRRTYRADKVEVRNDGWALEITYLDGSKVMVDSKKLKLKISELEFKTN